MMIITAVKARMSSSVSSILHTLRLFLIVSLLLVCAGCAASSTTIIEEEVVSNPRPMYSYKSLLIQNLELKRELFTDSPVNSMSQRDILYAKFPGDLSAHIERYVKAHGTYNNVSRHGIPDASTLLLTGKFIRLGRFKITVVVNLLDGASGQQVATFRQTLWDVLDTADSFADLGREVADFIYRIQYK